ncbi:MAG: phosphoribosylformylglycinamidine synthase subunit PurL [Nitrososphaerota archaeon]|nr:phosphoribosylformylglycinamidine synthase subunit PurL [Nitrososphaerales archaeon]MDW8044675.1 phosphoribosylformylglycinamidine synthase subunit PurL [Nitrososphaerota archaeon]
MENLQLNLTDEEIKLVRRMLGREPNSLEWAMIDTEWSEHTSYKSSRKVLKLLPTKGKHVVIGPGYDSGVVDVGGGYIVTLHIESHNHPSAIDPYGGAATGIGGVLRDILCMGTRPIALIDPLRFGMIDRSEHSRWLFINVVKGIADYGNCVGVPTVAGEVEFDESFERNCLVDVACIGVGLRKHLILAEARHPNDLLILAGGSTGRDGIHGVTFASKVLSERSEEERSAVQVPDPFMKKLIIDATLEVVESGYVSGLKDLGGGGLTCALSEVAAKGGCGVEVYLDKVHLREPDMDPVEIMLSESQERMLFIVKEEGVEKVCKIFEKYGVPYSIIGKVTSDKYLTVKMKGKVLARLPAEMVARAPLMPRKSMKPEYIELCKGIEPPQEPKDLDEIFLKLLSSPNICSREWIYRQYDHEVGIRTVIKPGQADAAVLKLPNGKFLAVTSDGNSKHCYLDPYHGAAGCMAESCRNIIAVGGKPIAMVDHCQFGDPGKADVYWTFVESVRGMADYCKALHIPCVGGKVSFYNEDMVTRSAIKPSPVVMVIGLIDDAKHIIDMGLKMVDDVIVMLGLTKPEMGGSEYYEYIHNLVGGEVPKVDFRLEKRLHRLMGRIIRRGLAKAIHDCSKGGFAIALAEMCFPNGLGVEVDCSKVPALNCRLDELLFSETHGRFLIEVDSRDVGEVIQLASNMNIECGVIGRVNGSRLRLKMNDREVLDFSVKELKNIWSQALPRYLGEVD